MKRVVVTGIGAVTPVGNTAQEFLSAIVAGKNGVGHITHYDTTDYGCKIAAEVKNFDPAPFFNNPKDARRADSYTQFAMAAAKMAYADAGLADAKLNLERSGVIVGSGIGGLGTLEECHTTLIHKGPSRLSPFMIPMMICNIASGMITIEIGFQGPNFVIVSACATSNNSIGEAWRVIRSGDADVMLAGGSEAAILPLGIGGFDAMKAISRRNDAPEKASRPFDKDRDGFVLGEGAGVVVLEDYEHAKARGAKIYGEIVGYSTTADAYHLTAPAPEGAGAARAMKRALEIAQLNPEQIGYINAHGTSTPQGDIAETLAIKSVFGDYAHKLAVSSTKSMVGHMLGAAGVIEMIACLHTLQTGIIHPTTNLENQDPECDLDYVPNQAREQKVEYVMNNSFGFGGHNACLVAKKV